MGRKKEQDIQRIDSPEALDRYIRVTSPGVWIVLALLTALLLGALVWSVTATVERTAPDGSKEKVHPIVFVTNQRQDTAVYHSSNAKGSTAYLTAHRTGEA